MSITLCTIARDEEAMLPGLLESVQGVVGEIILGIDDRTTDRTAEIAHNFGSRTFPFVWSDSFAEARNLTLERAHGDWILVLDPDERLTHAGWQAVAQLAKPAPLYVDGYSPLFDENGVRTWVSGRLFLNDPNLRYQGRIHEEVRYLPDPPRTWFEHFPGDEPHIVHLGGTPEIRQQRAKNERDLRLLHLRLEDDPEDAVAWFYLWQYTGDPACAELAIKYGERRLHPDRRAELEHVLS